MSAQSINKQSDRFRWLVLQLVGSLVRVRVADGRQFEGHLHEAEQTATGFSVSLRHVRQVGGSVQKAHLVQVNFPAEEVTELSAVEVAWQLDKSVRHTRRAFNTDTGISGTTEDGRERELVSWCDDSLDETDSGRKRFDDVALGDGGTGDWDQFKTAKELWGFKSTYHEEFYTTKLDKGSQFYKDKVAEAERIAAEITAQQTSNPHVAEERGQESEALKKMDDADRYTDVLRDDSTALLLQTDAAPTKTDGAAVKILSPKTEERKQPDSKATIASAALKAGLRADAEDFNPFELLTYRPPAAAPTPAPVPAPALIPSQHFPVPAYIPAATPPAYPVPHPYYGQPAPIHSIPFYGSSPPSMPTYPSHLVMHPPSYPSAAPGQPYPHHHT